MSESSVETAMQSVSITDHTVQLPTRNESDGSPTWVTRGSNFVVVITKAKPGTELMIEDNPDEYLLVIPGCAAQVRAGNDRVEVSADSVVVVPPGSSRVQIHGDGWILRCFSARCKSLLSCASNAKEFARSRPEVAPLQDWPAPPDGFRLRVYPLADFYRDDLPMWTFQSSNLMINIFKSQHPRDIRALTPHAHQDFEQGSISLAGAWVHHLRYPWTKDSTTWREDQTAIVGSPSVTIIPPPVIHTSRNIGAGEALLVDLFAPPRLDFLMRPGLVRNAAEYPRPLPSHNLH